MKTTHYIITAVSVIIVGAGGFFAGMKYQQSKTPSFGQFQGERDSQRQMGQRAGANMTRGEILEKDDKSITVKLPDESTKIILLSENTSINKTQEGTTEDLGKGSQIVIFGKENSDGSITAQNIQLNPMIGRGPDEISK